METLGEDPKFGTGVVRPTEVNSASGAGQFHLGALPKSMKMSSRKGRIGLNGIDNTHIVSHLDS